LRGGTFFGKKFPLALPFKCDFLQGAALHPPGKLLKKVSLDPSKTLHENKKESP
jgi:hypothetical protein